MHDTPVDIQASIHSFATKAGYTQHHQTVPMWKSAQDLARYRRIVEETRPEVVVETGTRWGGTAAWFADTFDVAAITVDVAEAPAIKGWPGVTAVLGSSIDPDVVAQVVELVAGRRCMVSLDSDHHFPHVQAEIRAYAPLVSAGCYLVVEDALGDLVPADEARRFGARIPEEGGALPAIEAELVGRLGWVRDLDVEGMDPVSHSPFGWWRRACPADAHDFVATRHSDGTVSIDRAPEVIHVAPELLEQLDLDDGLWTVGTRGVGAGRATYRLAGRTGDRHGTRVMERVRLDA